jgi:pilus assembly protein TadC
VLPDALFLIASNLKSGVTPFQAVKSSIRKEFGPLAEAFDVAINKSLGSKSFSNSLIETGDDINSELLRRSMRLFATAINSGSKISALLENMAKDIIERQTLKKELVTNTKTNSMFIMFMVAIGAPFLMAVSIFFVDSVSKIQSSTSIGSVPIEGMEGMGGTIQITIGFLMIYSYVFLFLTGFMASYFAGVMVEGDGRKGLNKAPVIVGASWIVFILAQYLIKVLLGGVF